MRKYKNLIMFTIIIIIIAAFMPNGSMQVSEKDTSKTKSIVKVDTMSKKYDYIFKQQEEVNKSLDDILLERKQQQQKMDAAPVKKYKGK